MSIGLVPRVRFRGFAIPFRAGAHKQAVRRGLAPQQPPGRAWPAPAPLV